MSIVSTEDEKFKMKAIGDEDLDFRLIEESLSKTAKKRVQ